MRTNMVQYPHNSQNVVLCANLILFFGTFPELSRCLCRKMNYDDVRIKFKGRRDYDDKKADNVDSDRNYRHGDERACVRVWLDQGRHIINGAGERQRLRRSCHYSALYRV